MFGVFAIDEILRYRGSRIPGSRTLCHPVPHNCSSSQQNVLQDWFDVDDGIGKAAKFFVNISENVKLEKLAKAPAYVVQLCEGCNNKNSEEKQNLQTIYMGQFVQGGKNGRLMSFFFLK